MSFQKGNEVWYAYPIADQTVRRRCRITQVHRLQDSRVPGTFVRMYDLDYQWAPTVFATAVAEDSLEHVSIIDMLAELSP